MSTFAPGGSNFAQQVPLNSPGVPYYSQQIPFNIPSRSGYPLYSSQIPPIDEDVVVVEKVRKSTAKSTETKAAWTHDDDILLVKAWYNTSTDSIIGNQQKRKEFWEKIAAYYNQNRLEGAASRSQTQVKNYYYRIMPDINKWAGIYNNFSSNRASGRDDDDDVLEAAKKAWRNDDPKNKDFKWLHVWKISQTCEKWAPQQMPQNLQKKSKNSETDSPSSADIGPRERPMGQQRAKRLAKQKAKMTSPANDEKWKNLQEAMDRQLSIQAEQLKLQNMEFCSKDISGMSEAQLYSYNLMVDQIKAKYGWE